MKPSIAVDEMFPEGSGPYIDLDEVSINSKFCSNLDCDKNQKAVLNSTKKIKIMRSKLIIFITQDTHFIIRHLVPCTLYLVDLIPVVLLAEVLHRVDGERGLDCLQ